MRNFSEDSCFKSDPTRLQEKYKTGENYLKSVLDGLSVKDLDGLSELSDVFPELEEKESELRLKKYQDNERKKTAKIKNKTLINLNMRKILTGNEQVKQV